MRNQEQVLTELCNLVENDKLEFCWFDSGKCPVGLLIRYVNKLSYFDLLNILVDECKSYNLTTLWKHIFYRYENKKLNNSKLVKIIDNLLLLGFSIKELKEFELMGGGNLSIDLDKKRFVVFLNQQIKKNSLVLVK